MYGMFGIGGNLFIIWMEIHMIRDDIGKIGFFVREFLDQGIGNGFALYNEGQR